MPGAAGARRIRVPERDQMTVGADRGLPQCTRRADQGRRDREQQMALLVVTGKTGTALLDDDDAAVTVDRRRPAHHQLGDVVVVRGVGGIVVVQEDDTVGTLIDDEVAVRTDGGRTEGETVRRRLDGDRDAGLAVEQIDGTVGIVSHEPPIGAHDGTEMITGARRNLGHRRGRHGDRRGRRWNRQFLLTHNTIVDGGKLDLGGRRSIACVASTRIGWRAVGRIRPRCDGRRRLDARRSIRGKRGLDRRRNGGVSGEFRRRLGISIAALIRIGRCRIVDLELLVGIQHLLERIELLRDLLRPSCRFPGRSPRRLRSASASAKLPLLVTVPIRSPRVLKTWTA